MISGYPVWVVLLIGCGVFCAAFVDAIGGGGGIISVPVYLLAGLPTHFALGTNKLSSGIGTAASTFRYLKNGFVDWALAIPSVVFALVGGSFIGLGAAAVARIGRGTPMPFGPALIAAAFIWLFYGTELVSAYLGWVETLFW
jgi:uncharacterized membrane protein YfcA